MKVIKSHWNFVAENEIIERFDHHNDISVFEYYRTC